MSNVAVSRSSKLRRLVHTGSGAMRGSASLQQSVESAGLYPLSPVYCCCFNRSDDEARDVVVLFSISATTAPSFSFYGILQVFGT
jgi:hypothetical protein